MMRQIAMGLLAGAVAVLALALARPVRSPMATPQWRKTGEVPARYVRADQTAMTEAEDTTEKQLDAVLEAFEVKGMRIEEFFDHFGRVTQINLDVRWDALLHVGVRRDDPVTVKLYKMPARKVLENALKQVGAMNVHLTWRAAENVITISSENDFAKEVVTHVYDVRDLVNNGEWGFIVIRRPSEPKEVAEMNALEREDALVRLIQETVDPTSWRAFGGSVGSIYSNRRRLIITNSRANHRSIESLLGQLRESLEKERKSPRPYVR